MSVLAENWLFLLILALFVALHLLGGRWEWSGTRTSLDRTSDDVQPDAVRFRIEATAQRPKWDGIATAVGSNAPIGPAEGRRQP